MPRGRIGPAWQNQIRAHRSHVAAEAYADGLFVLYKNDLLSTSFGVKYFDGALSEQCYQFRSDEHPGAPALSVLPAC